MKLFIHRQKSNNNLQVKCSDKSIETFMNLDLYGKTKDEIIPLCESYEICYIFHGKQEEYDNDTSSSTAIFLMSRGECIQYKYCS